MSKAELLLDPLNGLFIFHAMNHVVNVTLFCKKKKEKKESLLQFHGLKGFAAENVGETKETPFGWKQGWKSVN